MTSIVKLYPVIRCGVAPTAFRSTPNEGDQSNMSEKTRPRGNEPDQQPNTPISPTRTLNTDVLFGDTKEICIDHRGTFYRLKITRQDKLILNK